MNDDERRNGRMHALTTRAQDVLRRRRRGGDVIEHDEIELRRLANEAMREQLHAAIDSVMDSQTTAPLGKMALKTRLQGAAGEIVDSNLSDETLTRKLAAQARNAWTRAQGVTRKPQPGSMSAPTLSDRLMPHLTALLVRYVNDVEKLTVVQRRVEQYLVHRMDPKRAKQVVDVATMVAKAAVRKLEEIERGRRSG